MLFLDSYLGMELLAHVFTVCKFQVGSIQKDLPVEPVGELRWLSLAIPRWTV